MPRDRPVAWEFPRLRHIINRLLDMRVDMTLERLAIASPHLLSSKSGVFLVLCGLLARRVSRIVDLQEVFRQNVSELASLVSSEEETSFPSLASPTSFMHFITEETNAATR
jgi:hypothetical protein